MNKGRSDDDDRHSFIFFIYIFILHIHVSFITETKFTSNEINMFLWNGILEVERTETLICD